MYTDHRRRGPRAELPALDPGVTLVDVDDDLGVAPVQTLLLDRLFVADGDAYWVDAAGAARTTRLRELAPHPRYLDRVAVARGFTPYQYTSLIDRLGGRLTGTPSIVLATGVDRLYRDDDLPRERAEAMFVRAIASLARVAREHEVPVLVTRRREDEFAAPLANAARTHLRCRGTPFGPRFEDVDDGTETLVYRLGGGWMQTTLAYWREVLDHRVTLHEASRSPASASTGAH